MLYQLKNPDLSGQELIDVLKSIPVLETEFIKTVRHYKLEHHTLLVLTAFEKYFRFNNLPIDKAFFKLVLALHDIGKPTAFEKGTTSAQYSYTLKLIKATEKHYPFSTEEVAVGLRLLKGDPIGQFFQDKINITNCIKEIREMHDGCFLRVEDFFSLLTIYYQCDVAAYTKDDGGIPFLEFLFSYEAGAKKISSNGLLLFSPTLEEKYSQLKQMLTNAK